MLEGQVKNKVFNFKISMAGKSFTLGGLKWVRVTSWMDAKGID